MAERLKDARRAPFCWQSTSALRAIRARCEEPGADGKPLGAAQAIAVYVALTEIANEQHRSGGRDGFEASRPSIARCAGVGVRTVDRYVTVLVELGLLVKGKRKPGLVHLPNEWELVEPEDAGSASAAPPVQPPHGGSAVDAPPPTQPSHGDSAAAAPRVEEGEESEEAERGGAHVRTVEDVLGILRRCPRFTVSNVTTRVQVENAIAACSADESRAVQAAYEAVVMASDPAWRMTDAGRVFLMALQGQRDSAGVRRPRDKRPGGEQPADRRVRELHQRAAQCAQQDGDGSGVAA